MQLKPALEKIKPRYLIFVSFGLLFVIIAAGAMVLLRKASSPPKIPSNSPLPVNENPRIEQKDYLLLPKDPKEKYKTTIFGKITKLEGRKLTLENQKEVNIEIAENSRFYRLAPQKGLERVSEKELKPGEAVLAGNLSSSGMADYKADIFVLTDKPTLIWKAK